MKKDVPLEAIRGFAAIIVVLYHTVLGFSGNLSAIQATPFNFFINGGSAVVLFFVLSGYVLTRRYFKTYNSDLITRGVLKRWPRLMGPVLVTVLISWVLWQLGAFHPEEAGILSGSSWLTNFAAAPDYPFDPTIRKALADGVFLVFISDDTNQFDTSLWTMKIELIGSLISFGLALLLSRLRKSHPFATILLVGATLVFCHLTTPYYAAFVCGVLLARWLGDEATISLRVAVPALAVALYLLGYSDNPIGAYGLFAKLPSVSFVYMALAGSLVVITLTQTCEEFRRVLSNRAMGFVGELSFPLYLIHALVICSLGADVFIRSRSFAATAVVVVIASVMAAMPILWFNRRWVAGVNSLTEWMLATKRARVATQPISPIEIAEQAAAKPEIAT